MAGWLRYRRFWCVPVVVFAVGVAGGCDAGAGGGRSAAARHSPSPVAVPAPVASAAVLPVVSGKAGGRPVVGIPREAPGRAFVVRTVSAGKGPEVRKGRVVVAHYVAKVWKSGRTVMDSRRGGGRPQVFTAGGGSLLPALERAVAGRRAGSRVMAVVPPGGVFGLDRLQSAGVSAKDTLVFVLDIAAVIDPVTAVAGTARPAAGLPRVDSSAPGQFALTVPEGSPPRRLVARTLIAGSGRPVGPRSRVLVHYAGAVWASGRGKPAEVFDSTAQRGQPVLVRMGAGEVIKGWEEGLRDQKAGSRVLLVVPPGKAYGTRSHAGVPAGSTLVFAVDILAVL